MYCGKTCIFYHILSGSCLAYLLYTGQVGQGGAGMGLGCETSIGLPLAVKLCQTCKHFDVLITFHFAILRSGSEKLWDFMHTFPVYY